MTGSADARLRVAILCGRVREGFSGTQDFTDRLVQELGTGVDAAWVDLASWRLRDAWRLRTALERIAPDVILAQYPTDAFRFGLAPHAFALSNRIAPLVVTLHEFSTGHWLRKLSIAALVARAHAVVVTTETERATLLRWYPWLRHRIRIIPIASNIPARDWTPGDRFTVAFFGQIRPLKGVETFLEVAARAAEAGLGWRFRLFGSVVAQHRPFLEELRPRIERAGVELSLSAGPETIADGLAGADAALLDYPDGATLRRGSLLAAAGCGTPIITRHTAETPALVARNTAHADDPDAALACLRRLAEDRGQARALHDGALAIRAEAGWDHVAGAYRALLAQAAGRAAR